MSTTMAYLLAEDEGRLEEDAEYPAIRVNNICIHVNPRLHQATHGFEESIFASGYLFKQQPASGFFIAFLSPAARTKFRKNSKWLNALRKDHKAHKVDTLEVTSVTYNLDTDGFLEPIFRISFFYPDMDPHYKLLENERRALRYLNAGGKRDAEEATRVCCEVLAGPPKCVNIQGGSTTPVHCPNHISMLVLVHNVAQAYEKRDLWRHAIRLRKLCLAQVHMCQARSSILASVLHLTHLEQNHHRLGDESPAGQCLKRISETLERLQGLASSSPEDRKILTTHNVAFGLHCLKRAGIGRFLDKKPVVKSPCMVWGLKHLNKAISSGTSAAEVDREEARVIQAAGVLVSSRIRVVQVGAPPLRNVKASAKSSSLPAQSSPAEANPSPEGPPIQTLGSPPINPTPVKLCSGLEKISDSDLVIEILGAGSKQVSILEVDLSDTEGQPVNWQDTHEYLLDLEQRVASGRNFVSVTLNSKDKVTKLRVEKYNPSDEILSKNTIPIAPSTTFSNTRDIFGTTQESLEEEEVDDDLDTTMFLSRPEEVGNIVTVD